MIWLLQFLLLFTAACQSKPAPLRLYSSLDANETKEFVELYEKEGGETVEFVRLSTGEALARLQSESANPHVAVWIGGGSNEHVILEKRGFSESYQPRLGFPLSGDFSGRSRGWNGFSVGLIAFGTNTGFLKKNKIEPPRSYQDLLKPVFRGQIGTAYAYTSGTAYTSMASLVSLMGERQGFQFMKELDGQIRHYSKSGSACVTQAGMGEIAVCIAFSHDIMNKGIAQGYPLEITFPEEGAGYEVCAVSLIRGGPDLERGKRFVDWLYGPSAQQLVLKWNHIPLHPGVPTTPFVEKSKGIKKIEVDIYESSERHQNLLAQWRQATGK
ncbi:MAG: ABC transporter substrate-binding protein [Deltaproteobacteria bacterium]|nr:ABC transporter substrate-binding protein [Deltaproteobacteria bacterium]MBI4373624.1 ABC transporter substrate-binding protein [Deltaproteobacteria bacterium]